MKTPLPAKLAAGLGGLEPFSQLEAFFSFWKKTEHSAPGGAQTAKKEEARIRGVEN